MTAPLRSASSQGVAANSRTSATAAREICPAAGFTPTSVVVEGSNDKKDCNNGNDAAMEEKEKKKKRAVGANLYVYRDGNGSDYRIPIHSSLREEYRDLTTKQERCEFLAKNGVAKPYPRRCCLRAATNWGFYTSQYTLIFAPVSGFISHLQVTCNNLVATLRRGHLFVT
ncbi:hypothetical protein F5B21DRAFT_502007 [Xylaria acuta]|nr:hypothetical protein F5B21DRAFT_502007 [Xylaria acuta]